MTLIELLLVLAVLALAAVVVAPRLYGFYRAREVRDAAERIAVLAREGRSLARRRGAEVRLRVDTRDGTCRLEPPPSAQDDEQEPVRTEVFALPEGVRVEWDEPRREEDSFLRFAPDGRADPAALRVWSDFGEVWVVCEDPTQTFVVLESREP